MEEKYIDLEGLTRYDQLLKSKIGLEVDAGHEYIEIGGIKWATMNIGANSVTDTGLYFQWGDTQGYTAEQVGSGEGQKYFSWEDYKYGNGTSYPGDAGMTKYNAIDNKHVLDPEDDAITAAWGSDWRMPTATEFQALGNAVNTAWVSNYQGSGVNGLVCTDKNDSSKVLFFPACGSCRDGYVGLVGYSCLYYQKQNFVNGNAITNANCLDCYNLGNSYTTEWIAGYNRFCGLPVRGVYTGDKPSGTEDKVLGTTILDVERTKWNNAAEDINDKVNRSELSDVATTGDYDDLINTPTIPTVPTNVSAFTNDAGYLTSIPNTYVTSTTSGLKIEVVQALPATTDPNTIYIVQ